MEGKKYRKLDKDCQAVSELIGQTLMIAVVVLAFSAIAVTVFSEGGAVNPPHTPKADIQESINIGNDTVTISHEGGDAIELKEIDVMLYINGQPAQFNMSDPGFKAFNSVGDLSNDTFELGDYIVIDTNQSHGIDLKSTDAVDIYFVHTESSQVIQRARLQSGKEAMGFTTDYWMTPFPFGTAVDTSGGSVSTMAIRRIADGSYTIYYPSSKTNPDVNTTCQSFDFNIDATREGITEIHNVTLKIVYRLNDDNFKGSYIDISVEEPENWIRVDSRTNEPHDFEPWSVNVTSYVDTIDKLEKLKMRFVAESNAATQSGKTASIDFLGIQVK